MKPFSRLREDLSSLKLRSDDHGHSCDDLRIYCEQKLIEYADIHIPKLLEALDLAVSVLENIQSYDDQDVRVVRGGQLKHIVFHTREIAEEALAKIEKMSEECKLNS